MAIIVSIGNEKGGVAKTTDSMTLAYGLANGIGGNRKKYKVLLIDLDQQCNLTTSMLNSQEINLTAYDILFNNAEIKDCIVRTKNLDFIPADKELKSADIKLMTERVIDGPFVLKKALAKVKDDYDFIIIDTPRGSGLVTINAFTSSNKVILATVAETFSIEGLFDIIKTVNGVRERAENGLEIDGILINKFRSSTNLHPAGKEFLENKVAKETGCKIYNTVIRDSIAVGTAQARGETIFEWDNNSEVAKDFKQFITEFLRGVKNGDK